MHTDTRTDEQLVVAAQRGSRDDFAVLYERYFDPIYDYLVRLTRSRELAADLAQDTFIRAMQKVGQLEEPGAFKGWIYRIARSQALNRMEREKRSIATAPVEEDGEGLNPLLTQIDTDRLTSPMIAAEVEEVAALVWEAAEGLDERTYTVLDLTVRHGFDSADIAQAMGVSPGNAYTMVSRMKDRVEAVIGAYVMARRTNQDCVDLRSIIHGADLPPMTAELARSVTKHVDACETCDSHRRKLVAPANVMAAFAAVPVPDELAAEVWHEIESRWNTEGPHSTRRRRFVQTGIVGAFLLTATLVGIARATPVADPAPQDQVGVLSETIDAVPTPPTSLGSDEFAVEGLVGDAAADSTTTTAASTTITTGTTTATTVVTTTTAATTTTTQAPTTTTTTAPANQAPIVTIISPPGGSESCVGTSVGFSGTVTDPEGAFIPLESILWSSSLDGELGRGISISATPTVGTHTITFSAEDPQGAVATTTVTLEILGARVGPCATPPTVTITRPIDGTNIVTTARVATVGVLATVTDDFDTGLVVTWTSSEEVFSVTANSTSVILTAGCTTHILTASVTDSDGATGSDSVTITVGC